MIRLAVCVLTLSAPAGLAEDRAVALPTGFDGLYAPEGLPCHGTGRISLRDGVFQGDGWTWTVTDVIEMPGDPDTVDVALKTSRIGGRWTEATEAVVITRSTDGQGPVEGPVLGPVLVFDYANGTRNIWKRCD